MHRAEKKHAHAGHVHHHHHHNHHLLDHFHHHHSPEEVWLIIRDMFVTVAAVLFIISLVPTEFVEHFEGILRGVAYFFGAAAYVSEVFMLTGVFKKHVPFGEMYMPYVFGVLYVLMGIAYLLK